MLSLGILLKEYLRLKVPPSRGGTLSLPPRSHKNNGQGLVLPGSARKLGFSDEPAGQPSHLVRSQVQSPSLLARDKPATFHVFASQCLLESALWSQKVNSGFLGDCPEYVT